ncbi:hypothetical protein [Roseomonas chloroacetimidivorans]|uniref:hypothetical protein n=1 Tax=Roseomonas chloroacetimidivorans TaxID=1766656 RepID=UPI003C715D63
MSTEPMTARGQRGEVGEGREGGSGRGAARRWWLPRNPSERFLSPSQTTAQTREFIEAVRALPLTPEQAERAIRLGLALKRGRER